MNQEGCQTSRRPGVPETNSLSKNLGKYAKWNKKYRKAKRENKEKE